VIAPIDNASPNTKSARLSILGLGLGGSCSSILDRRTPNYLATRINIKIVPRFSFWASTSTLRARARVFDSESEREIYVEVKIKILVEVGYQEIKEREKERMVHHVKETDS
jgi:hypothetical protein